MVFVIVCIDLLGFGLVLPLLPIYGEKLAAGLPKAQVGMIVGMLMASFPLMQFIFSPLWGRLSDRLGRRPVLLLSLAGSMFFYACFGLASLLQSLTWMFVSRIGAGIAAATIPTAQAYIADVTPPGETRPRDGDDRRGLRAGLHLGPLDRRVGDLPLPRSKRGEPLAGVCRGDPFGHGFAGRLVQAAGVAQRPTRFPRPAATSTWGRCATSWPFPRSGLLLVTSFAAVFSLANFESTLSFTIRDTIRQEIQQVAKATPDDWKVQVWLMLVFAYIGVIQCLVQGVLVRRLANH